MNIQVRARISQCMIVKNEEKNIERALSWGKGIVSEQIVVDTGSTDRTVEIARQMGAEVYHFQWIDDFAAAKNYAIGKANYEWIAFLDADEYFTPEDGKKLIQYINEYQNTPYDGILTGWIHLDNDGKIMAADTQIRVFRNLPTVQYKRRIHEYLISTDNKPRKTIDKVKELSVFHTGYGAEEDKRKKKEGRNQKLIQAELKEYPDDYEMWGYLGNEYSAMDEWDQAEKAYRKAISLFPKTLEEVNMSVSQTLLRLLKVLTLRPDNKETDVMETYRQAITLRPMEADYDYIVGEYLASKGDYQNGEKHIRRALSLLETYGNTAKSMLLSGKLMNAYELLAVCCYNNGDLAGCVQLTTVLLKENPYLMSTLVVMLSAFKRDDSDGSKAGDVAVFLGQSLYDFSLLKDRIFMLKAAMGAGYGALVKIIRGMFASEELAAVDQALGGGVSSKVIN